MKKTILIFGAGLNQMTLIEAAKTLNLNTIVVDPQKDPPGKKLAHHFYQVAGDDYQLTKKIAIKHKVDGIVTGQMENPLRIMAKLAQEMGYIFHSPETIEKSTNKHLMKQAFLDAGIPCAKGELIKDGRILKEHELLEYGYPLIIKPLQAFSSRGVFRIENYSDYIQYVPETLSFTSGKGYLVEEFIEGPEYSVESITYKGETHIIQFTEKMITPYPHTVELGHIQPADLTDSEKSLVSKTVKEAIQALGVDNSAAHTEFKMKPKEPVIIEIGPRLGGDFIASYLTNASTGISMEMAAIQVSLGMEPGLMITKHAASGIKYLCLSPGSKVLGINPVIYEVGDHIIMQHIAIRTGDVIPILSDSAQRSGWVIAQAETREEVETICF